MSEVRIGLIEDDAHVRAGIAAALATVPGWRLAWQGACVADALHAPWHALDLLLLDLGLPDGHGSGVLTGVRPGLPVLVVSSLGDEATVVDAIERGAAGYLLKEAAPREIVASIQAVLDGGAPISPAVANYLLKRMRSAAPAGASPGPSLLDRLTAREADVLRVLTRGYSYEETARELAISRHTVGQHIKQIYAKLAVNSRSQAVFHAIQAGWLGPRGG